jgi:two-component system, NarL family, sensor kinase
VLRLASHLRGPGHPGLAGAPQDPGVRQVAWKFLLAGIIALAIIAWPVSHWLRATAEDRFLANTTLLTEGLADLAIAPRVDDKVLALAPEAAEAVDTAVATLLDKHDVAHIRVSDANGHVVYSDVDALVGQTPPLKAGRQDILTGASPSASLAKAEGLGIAGDGAASGELVEVALRVAAATGEPLLVEVYYDDDGLRRDQDAAVLSAVPPFLLALAVLQLSQLVPAKSLVLQVRAHKDARRRLLKAAIEASELERRRIARDLHDEVIQDLSGLSYAMESREVHAAPEERPVFTQARTILQRNVRVLRAMTTEVYPPDLDTLGLTEALARLAEPLQGRGIGITLDVPDQCDLDRHHSAMFYRVVRESLANAVKHAHAGTVNVSLRQNGALSEVIVQDDGRGFDQQAGSPAGHLGLRILRDTIREAGGSLEVKTAPGLGTTVVARFDSPAGAH